MRLVPSSHFSAGDTVAAFEVQTIVGMRLSVPLRSGCTHLQFRRFAGCPICSLHLRSFIRRQGELNARGVHEVVFFHASREALLEHHHDLPFSVVADPTRRFYRRFGVERSVRALLHPKTWVAVVRGALATRRTPLPEHTLTAFGLPADFMIDAAGRVLASKYGRHADDQWSVDEVLRLAATTDASAGISQ